MNKSGVWDGNVSIGSTKRQVSFLKGQLYGLGGQNPNDKIIEEWNIHRDHCLKYLDGEFACVIISNDEFVAISDPVGHVPLYYSFDGKQLYWAFELKDLVNMLPNIEIYDDFLYSFLISDLTNRHPYNEGDTLYKNIKRLEAGNILFFKNGHVRLVDGWDWSTDQFNDMTYEEATIHFGELFKQAVIKRIAEHKKIGIFLTGGMDSTSVATTLLNVKQSHENIVPVTFSFPSVPECDETDLVNAYLKFSNLQGHFINYDNVNFFMDFITNYPSIEQPTNLTIPSAYIKATEVFLENDVSLVLTGHGGDGVLYARHHAPVAMLKQKKFPEFFRWWRDVMKYRERPSGFVLHRILYPAFFGYKDHSLNEMLNIQSIPDWINPLNKQQEAMQMSNSIDEGRLFQPNNNIWPPRTILEQKGICCSHPFLDRDIIRFLLNIPPWYKHWPIGYSKRILRDCMRDKSPDFIVEKRSKVGSEKLLIKNLHDARFLLNDYLNDETTFRFSFLNKKLLFQEYQRLLQGACNNSRIFGVFIQAMILEGWSHTDFAREVLCL